MSVKIRKLTNTDFAYVWWCVRVKKSDKFLHYGDVFLPAVYTSLHITRLWTWKQTVNVLTFIIEQ